MNIYIKGLDPSLSRPQIVDALANILHVDPFRPSPHHHPINFHVQIDKARIMVHNNRGTGLLTLPTEESAHTFLKMYGSNNPKNVIRIGKNVAKFLKSGKLPNPNIIDKVTLLPFTDPWKEDQQEQWVKEHRDTSSLKVKTIQFGWICRDYTFSVECEESCSNRCHLTFPSQRDHRREIRIHLQHLNEFFVIVIPFSIINTVSTSSNLDRDSALVFYLNVPPSYEKEQAGGKRLKLPFLPITSHERLAPFTSRAIRLVFDSNRDIRQFRKLCDAARLNKVDEYDYPIESRNLFSVDDVNTMESRLRVLPWKVAFQFESLLRNAIDFKEANELYPMVVRLVEESGEDIVARALREFKNRSDKLFYSDEEGATNLIKLFDEIVDKLYSQNFLTPPRPADGSLYEALHVDVTPTTMHLDGPFTEQSNRVIRAYALSHQECFLRVSFVDEAHLQYRFDHEVDGRAFITSRIGPLLYDGLKIAGRKFTFLAYSQSALREHAVWFVKPFKPHPNDVEWVTAESIVSSLGTFHNLQFDPNLIFCPARYAARLSQAFTATDAVKVNVETVSRIDDICTKDGKYQFTDGVGTVSKELSRSIWAELKKVKRRQLPKEVPSAFQIRFMGSKGMISVDHTLEGLVIGLRPSMVKFLTPETVSDIEIARAFDKPGPYFLNRPLIMLLEGLGVPFSIFKKYQDDAEQVTRKAAGSLKAAASLLQTHGLGVPYRLSWILEQILKCDLNSLQGDEFYQKMLEYATHHILRDLKNHSRIPVDGAWTLVGVADTHRFLQENQIFVCIKPIGGGRKYLAGRVLISRSPTIHPGDVRIVEAIGAPPPGSCFEEEPLANTVVFSVQGDRPLPSCLGGGDLDGDLYNVIPLDDPEFPDLKNFCPRKPISCPASYEPAPRKTLERPSTMRDVADFVMEYINSDVVGIVAINWLIIADLSHDGIFDDDCITLACLHSNAVDYPKSGQPVPLEQIPKVKTHRRPDWIAPETIQVNASSRFYESRRAIGQLFRAIDLPIQQEPINLPRRKSRPRDVDGPKEEDYDHCDTNDEGNSHLFDLIQGKVVETILTEDIDSELTESIEDLFQCYAAQLQNICISNTLFQSQTTQLSEAEVVIGTIAQQTSQPRKRKELMTKVRENTQRLVDGIREVLEGDDSTENEECLNRAWTAWRFSVSQKNTFGAKSFGWIAIGLIFESIKRIEDGRKTIEDGLMRIEI